MTGPVRDMLHRINPSLYGAALGLSVISVVAMVSAAATLNPALAWRQALWAGAGLGLSVLVARVPYTYWTQWAGIAYGICVSLLAFVLLAGTARLGATRWVSLFGFSLQPAELSKLVTVWWMARYLAGQPAPLRFRVVAVSLSAVGLLALLVFKQPDLGSATILFAIWFGMVWVAGLAMRHLLFFGGCAAGLLPLAWHVLKPYQRDRLLAFVNPHADPLGAGYTIIQSQIAIGSGRWMGRGWFAGTQNQLNFLPERHSDFLFSVIGEEWGLLGCVVVIAAMMILLFGILDVATRSSTTQGRLLAVGVFAWIGYQALVNMGMVMGLLPVVGVPLPLLSYGGSSMVVLWVAVGMVQQLERAERPRPRSG